jgi:peroxiredoxin Q/BCP
MLHIKIHLISSITLLISIAMFNTLHASTLEAGQAAPEFQLKDQTGETHSLEKYRGQWVILYFYPKDNTPGCTKQACAFRNDYKIISARNTQVLGVSVDTSESHAEFAKKYKLPFPLLADRQGEVAKSYQALTSFGFIKLAKRHTFIIDPSGTIKKIYRKVDVATHSDQILADLKKLQSD